MEKSMIRKIPMRNNPQGQNDFNPNRFINAEIRMIEGEGNERKFELSFSSEEPYTRWYGVEILDHSGNCVNLERLKNIGVVLFNHKPDRVLGKVEKVWIENGRGKAIIEFDEDEESEIIRKKVERGTLKGVSVGYGVDIWEEVAAGKKSSDGRFKGPCYIAKNWTPLEISIVSVPADATVGVGRSLENETTRKQMEELDVMERMEKINENMVKGGILIG